MPDRTLTLESSPTGIQVSVHVGPYVEWLVTNTSKTVPDGTDITVTVPDVVGEPQTCEELAWRFSQSTVDAASPSTNRVRTVSMGADHTFLATYLQQLYFPTRSHTRRKAKFEAKADEEVMELRITALKSMMVRQQIDTTAEQAEMERQVGRYLNSLDLFGHELHNYRNFSQELYGLKRVHTDVTLSKEAGLKAQKWVNRNLDSDILEGVARILGVPLIWPP